MTWMIVVILVLCSNGQQALPMASVQVDEAEWVGITSTWGRHLTFIKTATPDEERKYSVTFGSKTVQGRRVFSDGEEFAVVTDIQCLSYPIFPGGNQ